MQARVLHEIPGGDCQKANATLAVGAQPSREIKVLADGDTPLPAGTGEQRRGITTGVLSFNDWNGVTLFVLRRTCAVREEHQGDVVPRLDCVAAHSGDYCDTRRPSGISQDIHHGPVALWSDPD
jgi:hypothetical protein